MCCQQQRLSALAWDANLNEAIKYLEAARQPLPKVDLSAFDNISYNKLSLMLADCYQRQNKDGDALRVLSEAREYLKKHNAIKTVLDDYQKRIRKLSK